MSLTERVYRYFKAHPGTWIDGRTLARVGGYAAWRTRLSETRRSPWNLTIENRYFDKKPAGGGSVRVSQYRYRAIR